MKQVCYISAELMEDLNKFRSILQELNFRVYDHFDLPINNSIEDDITEKIKCSDFVIAIIKNESPNIFFEIGLAKGLSKPIFLVADNNVDLPIYIKNSLYINASLKDYNLIKKSLVKWLDTIKVSQPKKKIIIKDKQSIDINNFLEIIHRIRKDGETYEVEKLIKQIFETFQTQVVVNDFNADKGADYAIWINDLQNIIGNPLLLIEMKSGNLDQNIITNTKHQLAKYMQMAEAKVGLVLYLDREGKRFRTSSMINPIILTMDLEDFLIEVSNQSLSEFILRQRNHMAHGGMIND